jgi:glucose/arabinose dehydrogenase
LIILQRSDKHHGWKYIAIGPDEMLYVPVGAPCNICEKSDPRYGKKRSCDEFSGPAMKLGPHVAPLEMKFYTGNLFPSRYRHQAFIAEHGS